MRSYVIRRLLLLIPVLLGMVILIFTIMQLFDPVTRAAVFVRDPKQLTSNFIQSTIRKYHLNDPVYVQFYYWMREVLHGNFGWSESAHLTVSDAFRQFLPATLELFIFAVPLTIFIGMWLGRISAVHRDKPVDHITRSLAIAGYSLPTFWLGLMLLMVFYGFFTGLFPPGRLGTDAIIFVNSAAFAKYTGINTLDAILNGKLWILVDALRHLVLPVITLTVVNIAFVMRMMRSSMLESLGKGYVVTAKAKGLDEKTVINKHAGRNALIPVITVSGYLVSGLMAGAVITETVFTYKGLGWWSVNAAIQLDAPAVLGFSLFIGTIVVLTNLVVDLLYAYVDPRIRLG
jgi:peptide/nickel transport system permease protein